MKIQGKTALVPGASRGIGRAIARKLAKRGVRLVLPWYDWPEDVESMKREFSAMQQNHIFLQADLRREEDVSRLVQIIADEADGLDILINNIERGGMPIVHGAYTLEINREQWQREMETTLHAKWLIFNGCLPLLQQRPQAAVVNLSSIAALTGRAGIAGLLFNDGYAAANRGIETLTRTWARLGAPKIRVNEIMLGIIDTRHGAETKGWQALSEGQRQQVLDHTLVGRTGNPDDVAQAVIFLLEKADYMTGTTLRLDGGFVLAGETIPSMPPGILEK
ncbi:MAG TPA: SDR family oxidoreductase [Desulfobulbaceae bacterium]|nr:SDR family oxidoreductase [Desulfobulbaceae bacterium]